MIMNDYAVVLTHNRLELLWPCVESISPQVDQVVVVDNASDPPVPPDEWPTNVEVVYESEQPPNLARFWNHQLERIAGWHDADAAWNVALLCDDVMVPSDWYERVANGMREHGCAAASAHQYTPLSAPIVKREPDTDIMNRMCGWAFMLAGEMGLRADESMHWWWVDTSVDWDSRVKGGTVIVPGPVAENQRPNDFTYSVPGLADQAGRDGEAFTAKYGWRPW